MRSPVPESRSSGNEYPAKPLTTPRMSIVTPITQLISRGLRNAPVKKIRARWTTIDPMNTMAAQWWTWRITRPALTWNEMLSVDSYASDMWTPRRGT